jgi:hypothetical protein
VKEKKNSKSAYSSSASSWVGVIMRCVCFSDPEVFFPGRVSKVMARAKQAGWVLIIQGGGWFSGIVGATARN